MILKLNNTEQPVSFMVITLTTVLQGFHCEKVISYKQKCPFNLFLYLCLIWGFEMSLKPLPNVQIKFKTCQEVFQKAYFFWLLVIL